ncbi:MAG TPA: hypothetical protein PKG54_11800 [Phycisphaerae bacterium]|jgi:hypothetical protein|nr:hypothetical protein [Phycisphaerae bacterium]HOB75193.1 hypothetical protein [Phycisphaerae bacterium]HOJ54674.1 hypothetical protein [Phycisphaerae bacterium]HOL25976.1 hypothetical protein [Phycisphaerae bacterium]HPP19452.1 hypothetical protein [Phycisphaerae bacterium]
MPCDLLILAQSDSGAELLYVIAILILTAGSAIFEKLRHKSAEAERKQRRPRPPVPPPVQGELGEMRFPPPVPPPVSPPWSEPERPARPVPPVRPRPTARQQQPQAPRRRQQVAPEPRRRPQVAPQPVRQPRPLAGGERTPVDRAVHRLDDQAGTDIREALGSLRPVQPLAELRSAQTGKAAPAAEEGGFRKPTVTELRRVIVLNEILGPPLGLRERVEP